MAKHPLDPAFGKLKRAEAHIIDLKKGLSAFLQTNPYRIVPEFNDDFTQQIWSVVVDPIPDELESIAADAVHNLRTPLDKMLGADFRNTNIHRQKAQASRIKFPGIDHFNELGTILTSLENHVTRPVIEFLEATEPYRGGAGEALSIINKLDNRDKHRSMLEPIKFSFTGFDMGKLEIRKGFPLRIGSSKGRHLIPAPDARPGAWNMVQPDSGLKPIYQLRPPNAKGCVEFTSPHDDMEVLTTTAGAQVYGDIKPTINVAFSECGFLEGEPVLNALEIMRKSVETTLARFRSEFF